MKCKPFLECKLNQFTFLWWVCYRCGSKNPRWVSVCRCGNVNR